MEHHSRHIIYFVQLLQELGRDDLLEVYYSCSKIKVTPDKIALSQEFGLAKLMKIASGSSERWNYKKVNIVLIPPRVACIRGRLY